MNAPLGATTAPRHASRRAVPSLGFVGLGWIGRHRLDALASLSDVHVAALVDSNAARLDAAARQYPDATPMSFAALLDQPLDGVVIATPNGLHAEQAIACLERAVPVFCQKPLATRLSDVERVIATARRNDCLLGVDFSYRHVRGMEALRQRIRSGELGELLALDLIFHNAYGPDQAWCHDPALAGGGCLLDLGVHLLDLALWLHDLPAMALQSSHLFSQGRPIQPRQHVEDLAFAHFTQSSGASIRLACSWHAHIGVPAIIEVRFTGSRAAAVWRNVGGSFYDFTIEILRGTDVETLAAPPDHWEPRALQHWIAQLRSDRRFDPQAQLIARSAALIEEIYCT